MFICNLNKINKTDTCRILCGNGQLDTQENAINVKYAAMVAVQYECRSRIENLFFTLWASNNAYWSSIENWKWIWNEKRPCNSAMFLWGFGHRMLMGNMPNNILQNKYNILRHMLTCGSVEHCVFIFNGRKFKIKSYTRARFLRWNHIFKCFTKYSNCRHQQFQLNFNIFTVWPLYPCFCHSIKCFYSNIFPIDTHAPIWMQRMWLRFDSVDAFISIRFSDILTFRNPCRTI